MVGRKKKKQKKSRSREDVRSDEELKAWKNELKHYLKKPMTRGNIQRGYFTLNKLDMSGKDSILDPSTGRIDLERLQRGAY